MVMLTGQWFEFKCYLSMDYEGKGQRPGGDPGDLLGLEDLGGAADFVTDFDGQESRV